MKTIHLHIDRIVIDGLPHTSRQQLVSALEAGLREWAETEIDGQFNVSARKRIQSLEAGQLRPGATPAQAAAQIVQSIRQGANGRVGDGQSNAGRVGNPRQSGARGGSRHV